MIFAVFALTRVFLQRKSKNFSFGEFLFWSSIWVFVILVGFSKPILQRIADYVGISRGVDLLIYGGILLLFYMVYRLYAKIDKQEQEITQLVTKIAVDNAKKKK
jgi:hypothetical protein